MLPIKKGYIKNKYSFLDVPNRTLKEISKTMILSCAVKDSWGNQNFDKKLNKVAKL